MKVINTGKCIEITADFDEISTVVEGLRKAKVAHEFAGNWTMADELAELVEEITNAEVKLY